MAPIVKRQTWRAVYVAQDGDYTGETCSCPRPHADETTASMCARRLNRLDRNDGRVEGFWKAKRVASNP